MHPLFFGATALFGAYLLSRGEDEPSGEDGEFGAVSLWMGGRGPGAEKGVAGWLGGRDPSSPYSQRAPTNIGTGLYPYSFGVDDGLIETMGGIDTFFKDAFSPKGRVARLESKVSSAKEQVEALTSSSMELGGAELEAVAGQIAKLEQDIDKWEKRLSRAKSGTSFGGIGTGAGVDADVLCMAEDLGEAFGAEAKKSIRDGSASALLVSSHDHLKGLSDAVQSSSASPAVKSAVSRRSSAVCKAFSGLDLDPSDVSEIRSGMKSSRTFDDLESSLFDDDDDGLDDFDDLDDVFGAAPSASSVLQSAALAAPGSWARRNVLQSGAADSYARRLAGTATNADFAVLRAARPGIASSASGPIGAGWSGSPWMSDEEIDELLDEE